MGAILEGKKKCPVKPKRKVLKVDENEKSQPRYEEKHEGHPDNLMLIADEKRYSYGAYPCFSYDFAIWATDNQGREVL